MITRTGFINYLNTLPPDKFLVMQQLGNKCSEVTGGNYSAYVDDLFARTGHKPAAVGVFSERKTNDSLATHYAMIDYLASKGVALAQVYHEPMYLGFTHTDLLTITQNQTFKTNLDKLISILKRYEQDGIAVLLNPFCEMTYNSSGGRGWWCIGEGVNQYIEAFKGMWRYVYDYVMSRVSSNVIWVFEPADTGYWNDVLIGYPGANYVDVMGFSMYNDTISPRGTGTYQKLISAGHPFFVSQYGPVSKTDGTWNQYAALVDGKTNMPKLSGVGFWSSWSNRTVHMSIVDNAGASQLMNSPQVITRESLMITEPPPPPPPPQGHDHSQIITALTTVKSDLLNAREELIIEAEKIELAAAVIQQQMDILQNES